MGSTLPSPRKGRCVSDQPLSGVEGGRGIEDGLAVKAVSRAGDAIVTVDEHGVITSWNAAAEALLGYTQTEALGQTLALIVPPEFRGAHVAAFHAAMDSGQLQGAGRPARVEAQTATGSRVQLAMSLGTLTDAAGTVVGAVAILRPVNIELLPFVAP